MGFLSDVGNALFGGSQKEAGRIQSEGFEKGIAEQRRQFDLSRTDLAPFLQGGLQGQSMLLNLLQQPGSFTQDPGAQFALQQGVKARDRSAAARGGLGAGAHLKDLERFGQGLASQQFNNRIQQLLQLAGGGRQVAQSQAQLGQQSSSNIANLMGQAAGAQAAGVVGQGNALRGLIGAGIGAFL